MMDRLLTCVLKVLCSGERFRLLASASCSCVACRPLNTVCQLPARAALGFSGTTRPSPASPAQCPLQGDQLGAASPPRAEAVCSRACRGGRVLTPSCPPHGRLSLQASPGAWPLLSLLLGPPPSSAALGPRLWAQRPASPS